MKKYIVTGASGQLGKAIVSKIIAQGGYVIGLDIQPVKEQQDPNVFEYHNVDITKRDNIVDLFQKLKVQHNIIHGLVNNAGTAVFSKFEERTEKEISDVVQLNMAAPIFMVQEFLGVAGKNFESSIVNIGSIYGVTAPDQELYVDTPRNSSEIYGMTKAAVINLTQYLSVYLAGHKIRCNCVSPGGIRLTQGPLFVDAYSKKVPLGRMGYETEIANAVCFLLDESKASYVNGANLVVDGGFTAWR